MEYLALGLGCGWGISVLVLAIKLDRRNDDLRAADRDLAALKSVFGDKERANAALQDANRTLQGRVTDLERDLDARTASLAEAWALAERCAPIEDVKKRLKDALS